MSGAAAATGDASPCTRTCVLDRVTGYCIGCGRSGEEIARWTEMAPAERAGVTAALDARLRFMTSRQGRQAARRAVQRV
jgi:predicted Fe-S protein YdhL (DUF1289 family)